MSDCFDHKHREGACVEAPDLAAEIARLTATIAAAEKERDAAAAAMDRALNARRNAEAQLAEWRAGLPALLAAEYTRGVEAAAKTAASVTTRLAPEHPQEPTTRADVQRIADQTRDECVRRIRALAPAAETLCENCDGTGEACAKCGRMCGDAHPHDPMGPCPTCAPAAETQSTADYAAPLAKGLTAPVSAADSAEVGLATAGAPGAGGNPGALSVEWRATAERRLALLGELWRGYMRLSGHREGCDFDTLARVAAELRDAAKETK